MVERSAAPVSATEFCLKTCSTSLDNLRVVIKAELADSLLAARRAESAASTSACNPQFQFSVDKPQLMYILKASGVCSPCLRSLGCVSSGACFSIQSFQYGTTCYWFHVFHRGSQLVLLLWTIESGDATSKGLLSKTIRWTNSHTP